MVKKNYVCLFSPRNVRYIREIHTIRLIGTGQKRFAGRLIRTGRGLAFSIVETVIAEVNLNFWLKNTTKHRSFAPKSVEQILLPV